MAALTTPYALVDGAVLDPDQYTDDIYDPSVAGRGLLSEPNGRLSATNLAGGFLVQAEHIQPGELFRQRLSYDLEPVDFYDDSVGVTNEPSATAPVQFVPVFGAAVRIYVPYRSLVLWQWQAFLHPWRATLNDVFTGTGSRTVEGFTVANIGGATIGHTQRRLTFSAILENTTTAETYGLSGTIAAPWQTGVYDNIEERAGLNYCQHHLELVTTVGYREMNLRLFLQDSNELVFLRRRFFENAVNPLPADPSKVFEHYVKTRASFGIRSAWALGYHFPA